MNWFSKLIGREKRSSRRHPHPPLFAFYWDGGHSTPHPVPNVSEGGIFIRTDDRWFPRTLMRVTLQRRSNDPQKTEESITLQCRVVRAGTDGVGMAIMYANEDKSDFPVVLGSTATRREFTRFIQRILSEAAKDPIPDAPYLPFQSLTTSPNQPSPNDHARM